MCIYICVYIYRGHFLLRFIHMFVGYLPNLISVKPEGEKITTQLAQSSKRKLPLLTNAHKDQYSIH